MFNQKKNWEQAVEETEKQFTVDGKKVSDDLQLSKEETEALAAAKAAELRENDRKLAEDKEKEKKKEERNKKIRRVLGIVAIILIILLLLVRCQGDKLPLPEAVKDFVNIGVEDTVDNGSIEDEAPMEIDSRYSMLTISMNKVPIFADGLSEGNLNIINDEENVYDQMVEIYTLDKEGKAKDLIYKSGLIPIGQTLPKAKLSENLPAGTYECVAYFSAIETTQDEITDETKYAYVGKAGARITITIVNTVQG